MVNITLDDLEQYADLRRSLQIDLEELVAIECLLLPAKAKSAFSKSSSACNLSSVERHFFKTEQLRQRIEYKRQKALTMLLKIEIWLDTLADKQIVNIVKSRYILGYSWYKVARKCYGNADSTAPLKALKRFMEKTQNN